MSYWNGVKVTSQPGSRKAPVKGASTTHRGMDVIFKDGKVRPEVNGTVYYSGNIDGYGNIVIVKGDDGNFYHYAHNAANRVDKGQRVKAGEVIATMGATGRASGPHTHIEVTNSRGESLHPQTKQSLGIGGNKLASQGFYGGIPLGAAAPIAAPNLVSPVSGVNQVGADILAQNAALAEQARKYQEALARRYDITREMQQADQRLQDIQANAIPEINAQMQQGVISPEEMKQTIENTSLATDLNRIATQEKLNQIYQDYQTRRNSEDMANFLTNAQDRMNQSFVQYNPVLQAQQSGQLQGAYQVDPEEIRKRVNLDNAYKTAMGSFAADMALQGHPEIANIYMQQGQQGANTADQYLRNAEANYQAALANQYGVPYETLMQNAKAMGDYQKAYAPNLMSATKEAMIQPEMNFRTTTEKFVPALTNLQQDRTSSAEDYLEALAKANKNYGELNRPGAEAMAKTAEQRGELQVKQPGRILDKYGIESKATNQAVVPQIQGQTSIGTKTMDSLTKAAGDYNRAAANLYDAEIKQATEQAKNEINAYKAQTQSSGRGKEKTPEELAAQDTEKAIKLLTNSVTNKADITNAPKVYEYLKSTGRYGDDEIVGKVARLMPNVNTAEMAVKYLANTHKYTNQQIVNMVRPYMPAIPQPKKTDANLLMDAWRKIRGNK